eukprot:903551_1
MDSRDECTLTMDDMFRMIVEQNFRCKYSGIPMAFKMCTDWKRSIERIDNNKGYTKENCVLICWEFNASDRSFGACNPVIGSPQWSEEKFQYFYTRKFDVQSRVRSDEHISCNDL